MAQQRATSAEEAEEACVLGIPIADPEVLKATQFVLVAVGINAFFLVLELVQVIETRGLHNLAIEEVFVWVFNTARAVTITLSGYLGVRKSSRLLLGCFSCICLLSCLSAMVYGVFDVRAHLPAGIVVLRGFTAMFFAIGGYSGFILFSQASGSSLIGSGSKAAVGSYTLLGISLMDLQVLKATQAVFTALGIIVCLFGSFVIVGAEGALSNQAIRFLWLVCLGLLTSMSYTAIIGVKKSDAALLSCFCGICGILLALCSMSAMLVLLACAWHCLSSLIFNLFLVFVFGAALHNATILRAKAADGVSLTATPKSDSVTPSQFGAEVPPEPLGEEDEHGLDVVKDVRYQQAMAQMALVQEDAMTGSANQQEST